MLDELRARVCEANAELCRQGLVVWDSGAFSAVSPDGDLVVVNPAGAALAGLTPDDMVVVGLDGGIVEGTRSPAAGVQIHLAVYAARPEVRAIAQTRSTHATAFAALGRAIPCVLSSIAIEFGGPIPCADYASPGSAELAQEALARIGRSQAVLMRQHGVIAVRADVAAALRVAVLAEDAARTVAAALRMGEPRPFSDAEVAACRELGAGGAM